MLVVDPLKSFQSLAIAPNVTFLQYLNNSFQINIQTNSVYQIALQNLFAVDNPNASYISKLKSEATNALNNLKNFTSLQLRLDLFNQSLPADQIQMGIFIKANDTNSSGVLSCYVNGQSTGFPVDTNGRFDYLTDQIKLEILVPGTYNFWVQGWNGKLDKNISVVGDQQLWTVVVRF